MRLPTKKSVGQYYPAYANLLDMATSPIVRREYASLIQSIPLHFRKDLATALLKHGEDKDDPMIPLLIWYGIEPVVAADPAVGIQLARGSKIPKVTDFIYRRLAAEPEGRLMLLRNLVKPAETQKPAAEGGKKVLWKLNTDAQTAPKNAQTTVHGVQINSHDAQINTHSLQTAARDTQIAPHGLQTAAHDAQIDTHGVQTATHGDQIDTQNVQITAHGVQTTMPRFRFVAGPAKPGLLADLDATERERILEQVVQQARQAGRQQPPADWAELSAALRTGASPRFSTLLDELSALFGDAAALGEFRATLADAKRSAGERQAALSLLIQAGDAGTAKVLQEMLTETTTPGELRRQAIQALASLRDSNTPALLSRLLPKLSANELPDAVNTLASTKEGARALLTAVEAKTVPATALSPFLVRQLTAFDDAEINALIKSAWGDVNAPKADLGVRTKKYRDLLTPAALAKGDVAKGKMLYMATCGACHKLFGEGQNVGPDITGSNRADLGYLLENVLDPNAVIGKDYQLNLFTMKDGRVMSGVIKAESAAAVKIAMMGGVEFTLPVADIAKREVSKLSTMPEGLFDALPPEMVVDLVKYLQSGVAAPAKAWPAGQTGHALAGAATVKGALEGETLRIIAKTGGNTRVQNMGNFKAGTWSGGKHLWWLGAKVGDKLTITFPVAKAGKHKLHAVFTQAPDYGIFSLSVDGKPSALGDLDLYDRAVVNTPEQMLGEFDLKTGDHTLEVTLLGKNAAAKPAMLFALDYLRVE